MPAEPGAGVFAVTVGGVVSGVTLADHVGLDLGRAQRAVVDAHLVDRAVEVLAPDVLPPIRSAPVEVDDRARRGQLRDLGRR